MVDYQSRDWLRLMLSVRGSVLPRIATRIAIAALFGALAAWAHGAYAFRIPPIAHTMIGVALGLLLVFRTNASYDRYWEGRRLLGGMVIRIRDLTRQWHGHLAGDALRAERETLRRLACAYYRLAAQGLRQERELTALGPLLEERERAALEPASARAPIVLAWITERVARLAREQHLPDAALLAMEQNLGGLTEALAGCERINGTPVPFAYAQHIKLFVVLFCFSAPFAMADSMHWGTPVAAALLALALFGIDEIGVEIEDPFGYDPNDLPVDRIGDGIERVTRGVLDTPTPE